MIPGVPKSYGYTPAPRNPPRWIVPQFVFQGGNPRIRIGSLTGGGDIYGKPYLGFFQPCVVPQMAPVVSGTGGGATLTAPYQLAGLLGGAVGTSSF
jgi:hypothetical protein